MPNLKDLQRRSKAINFWYSVFLGVFTVVVGILFIVQAATIYYDGISPDHAGDIYSAHPDRRARLAVGGVRDRRRDSSRGFSRGKAKTSAL